MEAFMVPQLAAQIDAALRDHAAPLARSVASPKALDVGCGNQPLRGDLEAMGYAYTSLDVHQNKAGTVDVLGAIDRPLPEALPARGPFDFIACTEVMEHVPDWATAFANLARLLKPGGKLLVTTPFFYPLHEEPYDFWRPTKYALRAYAERAGLDVVSQHAAGGPWEVIGTALGAFQALPKSGRPWHRLGAAAANVVRKALWVLVRSGILQRLAPSYRTGLYLSNVVVFARAAERTA
jgi:SAM-dependent methyltransferase